MTKSLVCSLLFAFLILTFNLTLTDSDAQTGTFQLSVAGTAVGGSRHDDTRAVPGRTPAAYI